MNYFDFFEIPISFLPDQELLRKKYLLNSRNLHPDFDHGIENIDAIESTALNNKAYTTLKSQEKRIDYILNVLFPSQQKATLPPDFLMEMMEVNENLMEFKLSEDDESMDNIKNEVIGKLEDMNQELSALIVDFDFSNSKKIEVVRTITLKVNYLKRVLENV